MLAKTVTGLIAAGLLLAPTVGLAVTLNETITALNYQGRERAVVHACQSKRVRGRSSTRYIRSPIVTLSNGQRVAGTRDEIRFIASCKSLIGSEVEVLFDPADPDKARINLFTEMWFLPSLFAALCALFYPMAGVTFMRLMRS